MDEYISKAEAIEAIRQTYCPNCNSCNGIMCKACGYKDCMDIVDDVKAADVQPVNQWISVNDRLPDVAEAEVLVWIDDGIADGLKFYNSLYIAYWYGDEKIFADSEDNKVKGVTHWMYASAIPEPPKDGDAE